LARDGTCLVAIDDASPGSETGEAALAAATRLGTKLFLRPSEGQVAQLAASADLVVLSPGIPPAHAVFRHVEPARIVAEIELGAELAIGAGLRVVAITGTNGKTTVTSLVVAMLEASSLRAVAAGNIGRPLIEVASEATHSRQGQGQSSAGPVVAVTEASSFQLAWTKGFHPSVACWLNFAADHLDWHGDLEAYGAAKARIWANQERGDLAIANAEDPVVLDASRAAGGTVVTFGLSRGDYREEKGNLCTPAGDVLVASSELPRSLPHDRRNALAAAACALSAGASIAGCRRALRRGVRLRHRLEPVAESGGITYFDDSKATTPSAVCAALSGFTSIVLLAGGRNKGLDLSSIADFLDRESLEGGGPGMARIRAVVAIGEAAGEIAAMFSGRVPVKRAASMGEAVMAAVASASPGDTVLLSPGCASFDWYHSYAERGDDFARAVRAHVGLDATAGKERP
ncbi:MAG: UDP-N-acetylmuramoyl-L-alanine--D-glutamate ligase, partial [Acidimicrobiales bacterium]